MIFVKALGKLTLVPMDGSGKYVESGTTFKGPIGVDADSGLVHSVIGTAANINDVTQGRS